MGLMDKSKGKYQGVILLLVVIFLLFSPGSQKFIIQAEEITITVPDRVEISESWITLGDIARIEGLNGDKLKEVQSLKLGKALLPGYSREIPREQIILMLENMGFNRSSINLEMPAVVVVKTASRVISSQDIINGARDFLQERLNYSQERVIIKPVFTPPDVVIPDREYQLVYQLSATKELLGNVSIQALVMMDQQEYKRVYLSFQVMVMEEVLVALRTINKGETIRKEDFRKEVKGITGLRGDIITDFNNTLVRYGVVNIPLKQGEVLTTYYLILPDIVRAGDELRAELVSGTIVVSTMVKACQNGKYGEYITVENVKSGHRFKAQVISSHLVRIIQD